MPPTTEVPTPTAAGEGAGDVWAEGALGVSEATAFTGMSRSDLYERMAGGELAYTRVGRRRLIAKQSLLAMLRKRQSLPLA